jgi:hypothetical protein
MAKGDVHMINKGDLVEWKENMRCFPNARYEGRDQ